MKKSKTYYIAEPTTKEDRALFKNNPDKYPYIASDMSFMPEGYLMSEDELSQCDHSIIIHRIPDYILKEYDNINDFVTDYWDGEIIWK